MTQTIVASQARKELFDLIDAASRGHTITITSRGKKPVVLLSQEEYESWIETLKIMSNPKLLSSIKTGLKDGFN